MDPLLAQTTVDDLIKVANEIREPALAIRHLASSLYYPQQRFYWYHPQLQTTKMSRDETGEEQCLAGGYIKVGYSPTLRRTGELLNFFPGQYPGGIPNKPSPLMAMLTTGLVGGGLGYGLGYLGEKVTGYKKGRMRRLGALLGALAGAAPGAVWAITNKMRDIPLTSPRPFGTYAHTRPYAARKFRQPVENPRPDAFPDRPDPKVMIRDLEANNDLPPLNPGYKSAIEKLAFPDTGVQGTPPLQLDRLNRVTYGDPVTSALLSPQMKMTTTLATEAASRMPGGIGPGLVTPMQMGHLAAGMGAGYASGAVVGKVLGVLTGMPESTQNLLSRTGMYAGIVNAVVPQLFGR